MTLLYRIPVGFARAKWGPRNPLQSAAGRRLQRRGVFFAEVFCLTRWLPGTEPAPELPLREIALVTPREAGLDHSQDEDASLRLLGGDSQHVTDVEPP